MGIMDRVELYYQFFLSESLERGGGEILPCELLLNRIKTNEIKLDCSQLN